MYEFDKETSARLSRGYQAKRKNAVAAGQQWLLTRDEFLHLWFKSGKAHLMGNTDKSFQMTRIDTAKAWSKNNVVIKDRRGIIEQHRLQAGEQMPNKTKQKISQTKTGKSQSKKHKEARAEAMRRYWANKRGK